MPVNLLPNLAVVDWSCEPRYRYVGSECANRLGADPTGRSVVATLRGNYAKYICSLGDDVIARKEPIFSACIFAVGDELMVTGRLFTPFALTGSEEPSIVVSGESCLAPVSGVPGGGGGGTAETTIVADPVSLPGTGSV